MEAALGPRPERGVGSVLFHCAPWRGPLRAVPGSALLFVSGTPASVLRRESDQLERELNDSIGASPSAVPALSPSLPNAGSGEGLQTISDYHLLHLAGRGAYGSVWVARDRTGVLLAVKVVEPGQLLGPDHGEREERALALVRQRVPHHPHLVSISHVSRQDGRLLYAMELADPAPGSPAPDQDGSQADTLARRVAAGRLPLPEALRVVLSLLNALEALHDAGLVHRDIKPGNVIFVGGVPKLADVGLATVVQTEMSLAGTPGYLPLDGSTGPDADLYALGKLLYQTVTGCEHSRVTDLGPLARMPLAYLDCGDCKVVDLEPLRKTPLRFLGIRGTEVSDLSPLAGLRLEEVGLTGSKVHDLTPLKGMPILVIELDFDRQRDGPVLRSLSRLRLVNRRPAADVLR